MRARNKERDVDRAATAEDPLGESDIIVFRYDVRRSRFSRVSGREQAFLGYSRGDWLAPAFLEDALSGADRHAILKALSVCRGGERIVRTCALVDKRGSLISALVAATPADSNPDQLVGQIIILDPAVSVTRQEPARQVMNTELVSAIVALTSQISRTISGYSEMMTRHLGAQGDDLGGEYALGIRNAIATLDAALDHLRPLLTGSPSVDDVTDVIEHLSQALNGELIASRGGG